jgi:hypothetical protein
VRQWAELIEGRITHNMPSGPMHINRIEALEHDLELNMRTFTDFLYNIIYLRLRELARKELEIDTEMNNAIVLWETWDEQVDGKDISWVRSDLRRLLRERRAVVRIWQQEEVLWEGFGNIFHVAADIAELHAHRERN